MFRKFSVIIILLFSEISFSQLYQGPATGSVQSGVAVSTTGFATVSIYSFKQRPIKNKKPWKLIPNPVDINIPESPLTSKFFDNVILNKSLSTQFDSSFLMKNFEGIQETNSIPPDPYIAVGPNHIMLVVNSAFRICKKNGVTEKTIAAEDWYTSALNNASPFDPKVIYDQFSGRWVMVWLHQDDSKKEGYYLVSVSDDDDPNGTWYNFVFNSSLNGTTDSGTWADYQGIGYDDKAIYLASNQWTFDDPTTTASEYSFKGVKIRAIIKEQLYTNNGGSVEWVDFWNIKHTASSGQLVGKLRPVRMLSASNDYYFLARSPFVTGQYVLLYKLSSLLSSPQLSVSNVTVANYTSPANANQLGGSGINDSLLIEISGSEFVSEPLFYNGKIYHTFATKNTSGNNSALRYISLNVSSNSKIEDISIEKEGTWYYYPTVAVDQKENVVITYSRSGYDEYPGAYYVTKQKATGQFNVSQTLKPGLGNYIKDYSSLRNRWGDYNGIWNDPSDMNNIWLYTEFAARTNTWGTWVGKIRLSPYEKANILASDSLLDFGVHQVGTTSGLKRLVIKNFGYETLQLSGINNSNSAFRILNTLSFPINIATYDSLLIDVVFNPVVAEAVTDKIQFVSNAENGNIYSVDLSGEGYAILPASRNSIYGLGELNTELLNINAQTGAGISLGSTSTKGLIGLSVNPEDGVLYALQDPFYSSDGLSSLHHLNAATGSAYYLFNTDLALTSSAFDANGNLYGAAKDGKLYKINIETGDYSLIDSIGISISSITINPFNQQMWASVGLASTNGRDRIYKINKSNGDTTFVGRAGTGTNTINALTFGNDGLLYGAIGSNVSTLIKIDTSTAVYTNIGVIGFKRVKGLTFLPDSATAVEERVLNNQVPEKFYLKQNYPNPFNPVTTIEYALPFEADVKLTVFNIIGQEVKTLVDENQKSGIYKIKWNATDFDNKKLSSGIYMYKITAVGNSGNEFKDIKKMILLK